MCTEVAKVFVVDESTIAIPVTCRQCGKTSMMHIPRLVIVTALTKWNCMALYTDCHPGSWDASAAEIEKIREFVGTLFLQ
jgi:hypothetical protein